MTLVAVIILSLATWRISSLLTKEAGPFAVFKRARELTGITHDDNGDIVMIPDRFFAQLLSCVWCTSVWVAIGWVILWVILPQACVYVALPFALSAAAIVLERLT
jgi:hypothetical protein